MVDDTLLLPTLDSLPQQLLILDGQGAVIAVNRAWHDFRESIGLPDTTPVGRSFTATLDAGSVTDASDREALAEGVRAVLAGRLEQYGHTYPLALASRTLWIELFAVALPAGRPGAVVSLFDVTQDREAETHLVAQANRDALTGLPNRRSFEYEAERALSLAKRRGSSLAVVFLDLDDFKDVNDTYGHAAGDDLLVHVAQRLQGQVRTSDLVARWGGDEFVMLLPDMTPAEYRRTLARYRAALGRPMHVNGQPHMARASFGVAFLPQDGLTLSDLLCQADEAMYADKGARRTARARAASRGRGRYGSVRSNYDGRRHALWTWLKARGV